MIRKEGSADGFLGVDAVLIKHIKEALGLCSSFSSATPTPAETSPLPKDSWEFQLPGPSTMQQCFSLKLLFPPWRPSMLLLPTPAKTSSPLWI
ncbi:hypothetical protein ACHAW6_005352 [Cyclotella cf. meneghiniana]